MKLAVWRAVGVTRRQWLWTWSLTTDYQNISIWVIMDQSTTFISKFSPWKARIRTRTYVDSIRELVLRNLSELVHAPSVQFSERPPDIDLGEEEEEDMDALGLDDSDEGLEFEEPDFSNEVGSRRVRLDIHKQCECNTIYVLSINEPIYQ